MKCFNKHAQELSRTNLCISLFSLSLLQFQSNLACLFSIYPTVLALNFAPLLIFSLFNDHAGHFPDEVERSDVIPAEDE
jgi:uncharacterized membrane protein